MESEVGLRHPPSLIDPVFERQLATGFAGKFDFLGIDFSLKITYTINEPLKA
jgi:hypothetical protein